MTILARNKYQLDQSPLYKIRSKKKLRDVLHISSQSDLNRLLSLEEPYRKFDVPSKGKLRPVQVPTGELIPIHNRIFALLRRIELPQYLHSGAKGRSYVTNAKAHCGTTKTFTTDIAKFYPSVTRSKVASFFRDTMKCIPDVAAILADLTTCEGKIPTGSTLSQLLAYFSCKEMFDQLHSACCDHGGVMTCYVDDLTFSGDFVSRAWAYETIKPVIRKHGLTSHKDKFFDEGQPKEITGVIVDGQVVKVCNRHHKSIYELIMILAETHDPVTAEKLYNSLFGKLSCAGQIENKFKAKRVRVRAKRKALSEA